MCGTECVVCWEVERVWEPPAEGARWLQSQRAPRRRGWGRLCGPGSQIGILKFLMNASAGESVVVALMHAAKCAFVSRDGLDIIGAVQ